MKRKFRRALFSFVAYNLLLMILVIAKNTYSLSQATALSAFMLFSFVFEFVVLEIQSGTKRIWGLIIVLAITFSGLNLIYQIDKTVPIPNEKIAAFKP